MPGSRPQNNSPITVVTRNHRASVVSELLGPQLRTDHGRPEMHVMARQSVKPRVKKLRQVVDSLGAPVEFRKLHGILRALEMQIEDGDYQRHAVTRLCEALLATAQLYSVPEEHARRLEEAACEVVALVEDRR